MQISRFLFTVLLVFTINLTFAQVAIWEDDFETDKDWTFSGEFERGAPLGGNGDHGNPNPGSAFNGSNVIGTDLNAGYENLMTVRQDLATSPTIDCSGNQGITISFQRWLNLEGSSYDHGLIQYFDGSTWTNIWTNPSATLEETAWSLQSISLPASANNNANVRIRFAIGTTDGGWTYSGWNIDDFKVDGYVVTNIVSYDFDSSDDGWAGTGWARDNSSFTGYGTNHWHTDPFNNYGNNTTSTITSSTISLSSKSNLKLQFDVRYNTENGYDGLKIEYSADNGSSWNSLGSSAEGTNWYNDASVSALSSAGWTNFNYTNDWETAAIELPGALENNSQVKFRFIFASDGSLTDDGVAFDNFEIYEYATPVPDPAKTWYAYSSSGDWEDFDSWTLDGAANPLYVNPDDETPSAADYVKIYSGKKITINSDNLSLVKLTVNGELDVASTTGHDFNVIAGNGKISMEGYDSGSGAEDNFPEGTTTLFSDPILGGTVEVYGTGIDLNTPRDFNNLTINLTSGSATMLADFNLRGDLTVTSGDFKINDNSSTTPLNIIVNGDVLVESGATMSVGTANAVDASAASGYGNYHKYYHVFTANGDFTNQGSVRFTNQNYPDFNNQTSTGAVSLVFNGSQNNTLSCQGTTDLYYLVINKGTDRTYSLTINATNKAYFSLFGDNNQSQDFTNTENPEQQTALWIKAGTLILEGYVYIPTLTEGANYYIGENASLVLNGSNVYVASSAMDYDYLVFPAVDYTGLSYEAYSASINSVAENGLGAVYIYGSIIVNDGALRTSYDVGLIYRAESTSNKLEINGGLVQTTQFHISDLADPTTAKMSYIQTGGELQLVMNTRDDAIFDLSAGQGSFIMSGGIITIEDIDRAGSPNAIEIACASNNVNVTGGAVIIDNQNDNNLAATISSTAPFYNLIMRDNQGDGLQLIADLEIINDLTLEKDNFDANGQTLYIGSDFTIEDGATFTSGANTTVFNGTKLTNLSFANTAPAFYNVTVAKTVDEKDFSVTSATEDPAFSVTGEFRLENGDFDHNEYNVLLNGNIYLEDTIGLPDNTGSIQLNGSGAQTITCNGGVINNINITNGNGVGLTGDLNVYGTLTLNDAVFDINTYKLTMAGADASIVAGTGFAADEMIMTNGNSSDGGLEMYLDDVSDILTFPIGTDANNGGSSPTRYTPAVINFSSFNDEGYVRISIADDQIPMTIANGGDILSYYWKVRHSDFDAVPGISSYLFIHDETDDDTGLGASSVGGFVLDEDPYNQDTDSEYNDGANTITFNEITNLQLASYSAGDPNRFNGKPETFYSLSNPPNNYFSEKNSWENGSGQNKVPTEGSIVIIRDEHRINVNDASKYTNPGVIEFDHDYVTYPTPNSENVPRLQFHVAGTFELGTVSGTGMISFDAPEAPVVTGDFGEFGSNTDSYYLYFGGTATLSNIPTPIPNLMVESATYTIDQDVDINANLILQLGAIVVPLQDMNIDQNLLIGANSGGTFQLPSQATPVEINIEGDIDFTYDPYASIGVRKLQVEAAGAENVEHKIILKGDIIHGSVDGHTINLWNSNTTERAILELQGESDNSYSRTSTSEPQLYRIILNKGIDLTNTFSFNNSFSLNGTTNTSSDKALELLNGTFILNDATTTIDLTTGNPFSIPSTAALEVTQGTVQASGTDGGIILDGTLTINGGAVDMSIANDDDANYIEYGASGNAKLEISSGTLYVGTQIRRLSSNTSGVLNYIQTGGDVFIGVNSADDGYDENRGMLEVLNSGSNFTFTDGNLTIVRQNGATPHIAALYLDPASSDVSGSTLTIGNDETPTEQNDFRIYSTIPLNNLTLYTPAVADYPNVKLYSVPLTLTGDLWIKENVTFDGNGNDLTIEGNMTNDGIYQASSNNLIFNSDAAQSLIGDGTENIYQFTKNGAGTLTLEKNTNINNNFYLYNGTINTDSWAIYAEGNVILDGTLSSTSGYGLVFSGSLEQELSRSTNGNSNIGILTINNEEGVSLINDEHAFTITDRLRLEKGVFNIRGSLLELGSAAIIEEVETFGITNMIQTNSSFQDNGIKKDFPSNHATDFVFPVGQLIYSPITIDLSTATYTSGSTPGALTVRPANECHPIIKSDGTDNLAPDDSSNVLQYYWILKADGFTGFKADISFVYDNSDMLAEDPGYTEADYIAARILNNNNVDGDINKFFIENVDEATNTIIFHFNSENDDGIAGDYFAGIDLAIPDNVATYTTNGIGGGFVNASGTYFDGLPSGLSTPLGAILVVDTDDEITFNVDNVQLYKTVINAGATLTIDETEHHRLGIVTGTGNLKITSNSSDISFPAGDYTDFFDCAGGGLEYAGTGSYTVLGGRGSLRNLVISGSGTKTMANNDIEICEDLTLNGPTFDNSSDNSNFTVLGDMLVTSGTFQSGASDNIIAVDGTVIINGGTYNGGTGGNDTFGALTINNASSVFNVGTAGSISVQGDITYSVGTFNGESATLALNGSSTQTITGAFTGASEFYNLQINNASGAALAGNVTIGNQLQLTSGLITPSTNTLLIDDGATISPTLGSSSSYINGKLYRFIRTTSDFVFPIGNSGQYRPTTVGSVTNTILTWNCEYFYSNPINHIDVDNINPTNTTDIKSVSEKEYWVIEDDGVPGSSNATIGLSWGEASRVSSDGTIRDELEVMAWNGVAGTWDNYGGDFPSGNGTEIFGTFHSLSQISFSQNIITLGSGDINNPLPVELISFTGAATDNDIELQWSTASEKNNDYFEIQRSEDAETFVTIGKVYGNGTTMLQSDYSYTDNNPNNGTNYYRLHQVDYDGASENHKTIAVYYDGRKLVLTHNDIKVYPNPYQAGDLILDLEKLEPYTSIRVTVMDMGGKILVNAPLLIPESREVNLVPKMIDVLQQGIYIVNVRTVDAVLTKKVIVN